MTIGVSGAVPVIIGFKDKADTELVKQHGTIKYNYKHIRQLQLISQKWQLIKYRKTVK